MNKDELKRDFILLNVGHARHNADWNWKNVQSPFARIHYVKRGTAKIVREDGMYELREGHLYLTPSYMKHGYENDDVLELYYLHIYEDARDTISIFDLIDFPIEIEATPLDVALLERMIEINSDRELHAYDPKSYDSIEKVTFSMVQQQKVPIAVEMETLGIIKQLVSKFLSKANYKSGHTEERILNALHFIHKNINRPIDIEDLAECSHLTKDHFIRIFKKEMNCTPTKYINRKKIETAQLRILIDNASIKDVAYSVGFDNIPYFHKLFCKITGESPGKYRKRVRL